MGHMLPAFPLAVSGGRFAAEYHLHGDEATARARAEDICIEQTIEFAPELVPPGGIREHVLGRIETFEPLGPETYRAIISYADELAAGELPQLVNVLFGNISMKPGIRLAWLHLSPGVLAGFKGPRFGVAGLRRLLGVERRPLLATAIKPLGLSAAHLADMAYALALGGMDIIKDDHGLANQPFARFEERVARVAEAIARANARTGGRALYFPNVTAPFEVMLARIQYAQAVGATGLLLMPAYCGLDWMRRVAEDDAIALPVMSHPAFVGSYVLSPRNGASHAVIHGQLQRLAGADVSVFPNYIGRFASYSREDCAGVARGCQHPLGALPPCWPAPGGGIDVSAFADMRAVYGPDVVYLMSSNLHRAGPNLTDTVQRLRARLEAFRPEEPPTSPCSG